MINDLAREYYQAGYKFIAGTDEAGRGPLAGPVVAAAVILPRNYENLEIDDSKKISDKKRRRLFHEIIENALSYGIAIIDAPEIDRINIYKASQKAMEMALSQLNHRYDLVLSDAMPLPHQIVRVEPLIHGDARVSAIAAASILAKVTRDDLMIELASKYPGYGFERNKGYGTKEHLEGLRRRGPIIGIHRFSYGPVADVKHEQLSLFPTE
ncbi:MAG: ribonuclease HII [Bacilli bacterium]|jgi:ribonuclease HII|nr:ribonuclease HII [Bacilli bacterium]